MAIQIKGVVLPSPPAAVKHFLLVLLIIGCTMVVMVNLFNRDVAEHAEKWLTMDSEFRVNDVKLTFSEGFDKISELQKLRLIEQFKEARERGNMHLEVTLYFYSRYYMAITIASLAAVFAAICLVLISKSGWASANPFLMTAFITFATLGAYFGAFPGLYQQPENIQQNKARYVAFKKIESSIRTYVTTANEVSPKSYAAFLMDNDKKVDELRAFPVNFNHEVLSSLRADLADIN